MANGMTKKGSGHIESVRADGGYTVPGPVQSPPAKGGGMNSDALTKRGGGTFAVERSSGGYKVPQPRKK